MVASVKTILIGESLPPAFAMMAKHVACNKMGVHCKSLDGVAWAGNPEFLNVLSDESRNAVD